MTAEQPQHGAAPEGGRLIRELTEAIRAVPGVEDLAPTLTGRALQLGGELLGQDPPAAGQGLDVHLDGSGATVAVDISVTAWRPTVATAEQVQQVVRTVLTAHHLSCTSVIVSVLALHP